jgi:flagellar basal body rod protein FlgC
MAEVIEALKRYQANLKKLGKLKEVVVVKRCIALARRSQKPATGGIKPELS